MKNTTETNNTSMENPDFIFIKSNNNKYGFSIQSPYSGYEVLEEEIDNNGYLYISLLNRSEIKLLYYVFDKNKNHISWSQIQKNLEGFHEFHNVDDNFKIERKRIININTGKESYIDKLYKNNILIDETVSLASGNFQLPITDIYDDYLLNLENRKEAKENQKKYLEMSDDDKAGYWADFLVRGHYFGGGTNYKLSELRKTEPNIEKLFPLIDKYIDDFHSGLGVDCYVDFDDLKTEQIQGIDFSFEELAKKMGDLFYEPLAAILDGISIELDDDNISKLLKKASNHILKAWKHCKPYIANIDELEKNSKHTFSIEGTNLSNEELIKGISNLESLKLKELLILLSDKLFIDGEADKKRGREKLANELFESSKTLKEASNNIISL